MKGLNLDINFIVRHQRPQILSDPYHDFSENRLTEILEKKDCELTWSDFSDLFGPHLPAGSYEEVVYFLPLAFLEIQNNSDDALDLITPVFVFCSKNYVQLTIDGNIEFVNHHIIQCLKQWTNSFEIKHFDKSACLKKGWEIEYFDYVVNSELVCTCISDLVEYGSFSSLVTLFVKSLTNDKVGALWFLELSRARCDVYHPPNQGEIANMLSNSTLLNVAYEIVLGEIMDDIKSPTYWTNTLNEIGL